MADGRREPSSEIRVYFHSRTFGERDFFGPVMLVSLLFFGVLGYYLRINNPPPVSISEKISRMRRQTRFIIEEPKKIPEIVKPKPKPEKEEPVKEEPVDLTKKPLPDQQKDETVEKPVEKVKKKKVRRVYGLKRVYSKGIGASGNAESAKIGRAHV